MKNSIKTFIILLIILLSVDVYAEDGWNTEDGNTYYYENNEKISGFKEIDGKLYFFSRNDFTYNYLCIYNFIYVNRKFTISYNHINYNLIVNCTILYFLRTVYSTIL